ncbi:MAG: DNA mismatch repair protein MutS, partial [Elusimicrobia bacterium]|nr:DNA mismatch repair protein MutS [Elusimicrobiota bacterium]
LALTARHGVPMCGVPYHSAEGYISKLMREGQKVAICEQTSQGDGKLFNREVVRLITAGTVIEDEMLDSKISNYLVCVDTDVTGWGLACVEVSTGEFWATEKLGDSTLRHLSEMLAKLNPSEIIAPSEILAELSREKVLPEGIVKTPCPEEIPKISDGWAAEKVWSGKRLALNAALRAAVYVGETNPHLKNAMSASFNPDSAHLELDESAIRTLELVSSTYGARAQTLWGVLDCAKSAMGSRMLRSWILRPSTDLSLIKERQDCAERLVKNSQRRESLAELLSLVSDVERILSRIAATTASPRDVAGLRNSLSVFEPLLWWMQAGKFSQKMLSGFENVKKDIKQVYGLLCSAINENPPAHIADGGVIKDGYNGELDGLRELKTNSRAKLLEFEGREKAATQIPKLKVGYNSVFGFYMEVTNSHLSKVPPHYIRKQTLGNCERFITQELKEMESRILGAEDRIIRLEEHLFNEIKGRVCESLANIRFFACSVAELDAYYSLSVCAVKNGYVRPQVSDSAEFFVEGGRHPIVEKFLPAGVFVPNDAGMDGKNLQIMVITGPNMSGKSVYLRQNALIAIMAQMGSFVPAKSARLGIIDRIMTRIGAHDVLSRGESTFMVEMKETAAILSSITPRSLVLLDEIGRGTSTFDGISIAWAVIEYIYKPQGGAKVLFATHYFELTELENKYPGIKNFNVEVKEQTGPDGKTGLLFLHKISPGPADKSYGIHVAEIAGLPQSTIIRAQKILKTLENKESAQNKDAELPMFNEHPLIDEIKICAPEKMTPIQALNTISEWKKRIKHG